MSSSNKPVIAMMYDFDRTLSTREMQEFSFIPSTGRSPHEFWSSVNEMAKKNKMDNNLAYMLQMADSGVKTRRPDLVKLGESVRFYKGVENWFPSMNRYAAEKGAVLKHYVISSGLKEMIEGTSIAKYFDRIYACEFLYDENEVPVWPKNVVNYTTKTQFVYRINKGVLDLPDSDKLNRYVPDSERPVPFRNMIYLGDGMTDVPCMKVVKVNGGHSIAVYDKDRTTASKLVRDGRVNFACKANYEEGSELSHTVKDIIDWIVCGAKLSAREARSMERAKKGSEGRGNEKIDQCPNERQEDQSAEADHS